MVYLTSPNHSDDNAVVGDQQVAKAFALIPQSDPVLEATLQAVGDRSLNPSLLSSMITVVNNRDTQFVTIQVSDSDPKRAAQLATEITKQSITQLEATKSGQIKQFMKQELDRLEIKIKNQEQELASLQDQAASNSLPPSQIALINQLNTDLDQERALYNQMLNSYTSMSDTQAILLQNAQIPRNPVGAGPIVAVAIGVLAGLVANVAVILYIERHGILRPTVQDNQLNGQSTNVKIKSLPTMNKLEQTLSAMADLGSQKPESNAVDEH